MTQAEANSLAQSLAEIKPFVFDNDSDTEAYQWDRTIETLTRALIPLVPSFNTATFHKIATYTLEY